MAKSLISPSWDTAPPDRPRPALSQRLRPAPQPSGRPHPRCLGPCLRPRTPAAAPHQRPSPGPRPALCAPAHSDPRACSRPRTPAAPAPRRVPGSPHPAAHAPQPVLRLCRPDRRPWTPAHPPRDPRLRRTPVSSTPAGAPTCSGRPAPPRHSRRCAGLQPWPRGAARISGPQRALRHGSGERSPPRPAPEARAKEERTAAGAGCPRRPSCGVSLPTSPPERLVARANPEAAILVKSKEPWGGGGGWAGLGGDCVSGSWRPRGPPDWVNHFPYRPIPAVTCLPGGPKARRPFPVRQELRQQEEPERCESIASTLARVGPWAHRCLISTLAALPRSVLLAGGQRGLTVF